VVFVLATTDPQKVRDTIRSRTQHLRFHLLPPDELADHVRWVASDAGLDVDDTAIDAALVQGGGSARDTLSALELIANAGGAIDEAVPVDELVQAMIDHDAGHALTAMAHAVNAGHEPRVIVDALVRHLRNGFLSLMAPELVQLSTHQVDDIAGWAQRLGPAALVKAIERFGEILVELRHAPDPRVLVEVALVQLTAAQPADAEDLGALAARVTKLEQAATGRPATPPAPIDPATGRTALGGRARREPSPKTPPAAPPATAAEPEPGPAAEVNWEQFKKTLRGLARAVYTAVDVVGIDGGTVTMVAPSAPHLAKCEQHRAEVEAAWASATGRPITITLGVAERATAPVPAAGPADDDAIDLDDLVDAGQGPSTLDRLAEAFPGAELVDKNG
jgi:DNA polymerase-3 subunit gamma/tau